jgi:hypothetical protein
MVVGVGDEPGKWRCRCVCGTERDVMVKYLRKGASKSCGVGPCRILPVPNYNVNGVVLNRVELQRLAEAAGVARVSTLIARLRRHGVTVVLQRKGGKAG